MSDETYTFVYQSQGNHTVMVSGAYYDIDAVLSAMEDFLRAIYRLPADEHLEIVEEQTEYSDE